MSDATLHLVACMNPAAHFRGEVMVMTTIN